MSPARAGIRPLRSYLLLFALGVTVAASIGALEWDLSALLEADERARALGRLKLFFASFGAPNLEGSYLQRAAHLTVQTLVTALLGAALGLVLGYGLALGASRAVVIGHTPPARGPVAKLLRAGQRALIEFFRLILDVLRGVPDFAWAILILTIPGPGPITGILAIGISVAGILGKIFSELWDAAPSSQYEALLSTGASRAKVFLYGVQPLTSRSMLSYTLMRTECAVRNSSVIGAVGGGGLGADMFDEFNYGNYANVVTLLLFMLLLTAGVDILSNLLRYQLRNDPNHSKAARTASRGRAVMQRLVAAGGAGGVLGFCWHYLRTPFLLDEPMRVDAVRRAKLELSRIEWGWIGRSYSGFLKPDFSVETLREAWEGIPVPLAMAVLGTLGAVLLAGLLAWPASVAFQADAWRFTGERRTLLSQTTRWIVVVTARSLALLTRAVPEVAWVWLAATFFRIGILPGVLAIALHSSGVLARVFTETLDNHPYRRFEQAFSGSRGHTFLYAGLPMSWRNWLTYSFFQFESNVRAGVVLGILGVGGIGFSFYRSFQFSNYPRASTFLLGIIALTVVIDRLSRALKLARV